MNIRLDPSQQLNQSNQVYRTGRQDTNRVLNTAEAEPADETRKADFDTVSIGRNNKVDDGTFASALAKKTASEVENGVSRQRVEEIKSRVQNGSYRVDAMTIAQHMLGYQE